ncbi:MarR family winged helix-turn-helix transcriptional regulator [Methanococcoides sp. LMO-2]|uniref:MarR family transcriptional regulator n=1 Tax=Methanococcoides cohabitans TaxID=3136559 RepID=A0ABU9KTM2_9EURY
MPSTLARFLDLKKSSVTSLIDNLEKEGFVFRKDDPSDRRKVLISVTEKGIEQIGRVFKKMVSVVKMCMDDVDGEKLDKLLEAEILLIEFHRHMYDRSVELLDEKCSLESKNKQ